MTRGPAPLIGALLLLLLGLAAPARAQDFEAARKHFEAATEAYGKGHYIKAAVEFDAAYVITKDPTLLYNIADSNERAGRFDAAARYYRRYVSESPTADDRPTVERKIAELERRHGLKPPAPTPIVAPPAPRTGPPAGTTKDDAARRMPPSLPPGAPRTGAAAASPGVEAAPETRPEARRESPRPPPPVVRPGGTTARAPSAPASASGPGGRTQPAKSQPASPPSASAPATGPPRPPAPLPPAPAASPSAPSASPPPVASVPGENGLGDSGATPRPTGPAAGSLDEEKPSPTRLVAWVGVATTVAFLTAGAIFALAAQSRSDEISRQQTARDPQTMQPPVFNATLRQQFKDLRSEGQTYDAVGIGFFTAAGVVAVTSGVLFYLDHRKGSEHHTHIAPVASPSQVGVVAGWEF